MRCDLSFLLLAQNTAETAAADETTTTIATDTDTSIISRVLKFWSSVSSGGLDQIVSNLEAQIIAAAEEEVEYLEEKAEAEADKFKEKIVSSVQEKVSAVQDKVMSKVKVISRSTLKIIKIYSSV